MSFFSELSLTGSTLAFLHRESCVGSSILVEVGHLVTTSFCRVIYSQVMVVIGSKLGVDFRR